MNARSYPVIGRKRRLMPEMPVSPNDFRLGQAAPFDAGQILRSPQISPYCVDPKNKEIVFVETPAGLDILAAPFYYLAQYEHATRVITLSFDEFIQLADPLPLPDKRFLFLYTVGRAGSTLLTRIFAGDRETVSISEPDILTGLSLLPRTSSVDQELVKKLLMATFKIFSSGPATAGMRRIFIKPRGYCIEMGELIHALLPDARGIFLYRNAKPVIESFIRAFSIAGPLGLVRDTLPSRLALTLLVRCYKNWLVGFFPALREYSYGTVLKAGWTGMLCISWLSVMLAYVRLYRRGLEIKAVLYDDIVNHPREVVAQLFRYCAIPPGCLAQGLKALEKDSQAGTRLARSVAKKKQWQMKPVNMEHVRIILEAQPEVRSADYIAPGTITPGGARP